MTDSSRPLSDSLAAAKHPPEYRLHKYWARKPHNVAAAFLAALVPPGGAVLDPFCGSGVILAEARARSLAATGIDLNPAAALIAGVTANPPRPKAFEAALDAFLAESRAALAPRYRLPDGSDLRFAVHAARTVCPGCGATVSAWTVRAQGRRRRCPTCGTALRINLTTLTGTDVVAVVMADGETRTDLFTLEHQREAAYADPPAQLDGAPGLLTNHRILAWEGLRAADLFTPRSHTAALRLRRIVDGLDAAPEVAAALRALFTASLAGFSRLVAYRDGLRGGGPAWSVPGFWVAPVHVEHNPLPLLDSWARRYRRGIARLWSRLHEGPPAVVIAGAAQDVLGDLAGQEQRFDLLFLDPPYGDSVPYLEYAALWNTFLEAHPDYDREVVVSNRIAQPADWTRYEARLREVIGRGVRLLKPEGATLVTFNNQDGRAWAALLGALQAAGLRCESAHYVAPAVISAKAQFAPDGSYHGDFWCVFRRGAITRLPASQWASSWEAAIPPAVVGRQRRRRLALRAILVGNLPAEAVLRLDSIT